MQHVEQGRFVAAGFCFVTVFPASRERERHQDAFDSSVGRQSKLGAAVVNEVELHVASSTKLLPCLLLRCERQVDATFQNGHVSLEKFRSNVVHEGKARVFTAGAQVVEENTTNAASFASMWNVKVIVAPALEPLVIGDLVAIARRFVNAVKMNGVLFKQIGGR